jgi:hypothetical protein
MQSNAAQRTLDWYRLRIGNFTGSEVGKLFVSGRKKEDMFGQGAMTYIYKKAAERSINPDIIEDDVLFETYLQQNTAHSKAMDWGIEQEPMARELYAKIKGYRVVEVGLCKHLSISHFASSPDGYVYDNKDGKGCLEIKCLSIDNFMSHFADARDAEGLKKVNSIYYYQCMAHMACTGSSWCDFAVYNPFLTNPIHIIRILPDENVFSEFEARINAANDIIENLLKLK